MIEPNVTGWQELGRHGNSLYYVPSPGVLAVVPDRGVHDDQASARENVAYQHEYFKKAGAPGVVLIFFDRMASLDPGARRVYQQEIDPALICGAGLIGGTLLSRAMGSFFLGLAKPRVALRMFGDVPSALGWSEQLVKERRAS